MHITDTSLILSPTDLSGFLTCRHRTGLDLAVAHRVLAKPVRVEPFAATLQRLGEEHEQRYVASLRASGLTVVDIGASEHVGGSKDPPLQREQTVQAMRDGVDVIVQARLEGAEMAGYADILVRIDQPSDLGAWSYEVQDTKLARETKGGTILQLSAYSDLLAAMQGRRPDRFHVVTPDPVHPVHGYRVRDYAAYYRMVLAALRAAVGQGHEALIAAHYPEPVDACAVCRWDARCERRRRRDDHLSFIANVGRVHRVELTSQGHPTLAAAAAMPVPVTFKPSRGARETYNRIGDQARVQHQQREEQRPICERLPVVAGEGLCRLPPPSPGDVFLDLEGARFAREDGREYLFGVWWAADDGPPAGIRQGDEGRPKLHAHAEGRRLRTYRALWAMNDAEEKAAFEEVIDLVMDAWARDPGMHVYHFNHYEPTAFKKLMGRHATRAEALDQLLRAGRFVDLYPITRRAVRAGVESYSIKKLEQFSAYERRVALGGVNEALMAAELALESNAPEAVTGEIRCAIQSYNEDDCRSIEALRNWLESLRTRWEGEGIAVPRPDEEPGSLSPEVSEQQERAEALRARLLDRLPVEASDPAHSDHPRWLLAYLVDWHRREDKAQWWEYFRLRDLPDEELLDERKAIVGLRFETRLEEVVNRKTRRPTGSVVDRYAYPGQDVEIRRKNTLKLQDDTRFGEVTAHDRDRRTIDVKKGAASRDLHPHSAFSADVVSTATLQESVMRLAANLLSPPADSGRPDGCGMALLHRRAPRLTTGAFEPRHDETSQAFAVRIVTHLDQTTLSIQGPPGAGKTYVGAQMIRALVRAGRRVGVTAISHQVIRNLLQEVEDQATRAQEPVRLGAKVSDADEQGATVRQFEDNDEALAAVASRDVNVLGGTAWLWARGEAALAVDVLFVDEAGQMSLANVLSVSHATNSLVLLGDPQQLQQPEKGTHPDGVGVSTLQHVLGDHETMPADRGIFLPTTWRMSPAICAYTSELFYEKKLEAKAGLAAQELRGTRVFDGSFLWLVPVDHHGNQSACDEEVEVVARIASRLVQPGACWVDEDGLARQLSGPDIRGVAPFNAQVNRLSERLAGLDVPVGTVDRFQGQTCAVVIYSMTTSDPQDAPHGMEFLYSLNRLNVATSRARCAVILVASPRLLEPECRTPRQMQLANALCRYREMARVVAAAATFGEA